MRIDIEEIKRRQKHHERIRMAGVDDPSETDLGPYALLWRRFRDLEETWEILPMMMAKWTLEAIPVNEPDVGRAALYQRIPSNVPFGIIGRLVKLKLAAR